MGGGVSFPYRLKAAVPICHSIQVTIMEAERERMSNLVWGRLVESV